MAASLLDALEASLRIFEKHRIFLLGLQCPSAPTRWAWARRAETCHDDPRAKDASCASKERRLRRLVRSPPRGKRKPRCSEAGAQSKRENVQRVSRRPDTIPKYETRYHPKA